MKKNTQTSLRLRVFCLIVMAVMLFNVLPMAVFAQEIANTPEDATGDNAENGDVTEPDTDEDISVDYSNPVDVSSSAELETALAEGQSAIRITADFELDRTFYVTADTVIISDVAHTLKRAATFGSDIFVVGETKDGEATEEPVVFTVGKPDETTESMIVIDGNAENMETDVVGTVFFIRQGSRADLYHNLTVKNNVKVGNEKTIGEEYKLSYPPRIGGAVAIVSYKASLRIYGGLYTDNRVNDITDADTDEGNLSSQGGVLYNYGTTDIFGGTFDGNHAGRGGAFYNYRTMNIYNAKITNNTASSLGGAIYVPNSTAAYLYIGEDNDLVESNVIFEKNSSESNGGAIYAQHVATIKNTQFIENSIADGNGGAISAGAMELSVENTIFKNNSVADGYGGAIYLSGNNGDEDIRELIMDNTAFIGNSSSRGGAIYMSGTSRGYFSNVKFDGNTSTSYGGAMHVTNASIEINKAEILNNSADSNGGAISLYSSASAVMNNITADGNSAGAGGFVYQTEATLDLYNSTIKNNSASKNGGAVYAYTDAVFNAYATEFTKNSAGTGGAVMIYNGGLDSVLHSCTFTENTATSSGGAIYISNKSQVDIYNIKAIDNASEKGGFLYETTAGTVVTLVGTVLSGNTASVGGAIIWGNTKNAKLYIDKIKYVDNDYTGDWDDSYWSTAIYNLLTVYDQVGTIPSYEDYSGTVIEPPVAESITNVQTSAQLERALEVGYTLIRIAADFELDRTFYVTSNATIFADEAHTLKRAAGFGGDIFVVGRDSKGNRIESEVILTLAKIDGSDAMLTISGNSDAMTVDVVGTLLLVCTGAKANLGINLTVDGHTKVGNDRILSGYTVSYPIRVGGAVAIIESKAVMNIYGGIYSNNKANDITDASTDAGSVSGYGGAFYNYGTMNIYGGRFEGNHAGRGGAFYNYRTMNIYNATIIGNTASTFGGAIYTPNSDSAFLYVGAENDVVQNGTVYFTNNSAVSGGGAIYANNLMVIENAVFEGNSATGGNGGALHASSTVMTFNNVTFKANTSSKYGGAIYLTGNNELEEALELKATDCIFTQNSATSRAGAIYMSGASRAYFEDVDFSANTTATGAVFYLNNASIDINGSSIKNNTATGNGGVILALSSSSVLINDADIQNNAASIGGVAHLTESACSIYNSTVSNNSAVKNGGAFYAYTSAIFNAYNTNFNANQAGENGGAVMIYNGGLSCVLHSCTFAANVAQGVGGGLYISNKSLVDMYNITAKNNSAPKGGFLYETTSGTVVDLVGLTVSGNTATEGGAIIWGNTTNAVLNIDKTKYTDADRTAPLDSAYWSTAIYNKLTVKEITESIPKYLDYGNESYDHLSDAVDVSNAAQLEAAIQSGAKNIRIVADFEIDRTFFISGDVTIFTTIKHTLKRAPTFGGDFFVIGEDASGTSSLLLGHNAKLTLGNPLSKQKDLLVFDGNRDNMQVDVVGSVLFIVSSSTVNLYENVSVINCHKIGNDRTLSEKYLLGIRNRIGGTLAVVASGTLNIYGGYYANNSINEKEQSDLGEAGRNSTVGALIFNYSNLRIYGGTFENNIGARGGVIYNYRVTRIFGGTFIGNEATVSGGVYYAPNSAQVHLYVGTTDGVYGDVTFRGNKAQSSGGVIYASTLTANVIYGNTSFINNSTGKGSGGAICMYGQLTVRDADFESNTAFNRGGAIYASNSSLESVTRFIELTRCTFINNEGTLGGAISLYASAADYPEGAIATVTACQFTQNKASLEVGGASNANGGAIYADRKVSLTVKESSFTENTAATEAGAIYLAGESVATVSDSLLTSNTAAKYGGAFSVRSSYLTLDNTDVIKSFATSNGGAIYVSYQSNREINSKVEILDSLLKDNESAANGGAIYVTRRSAVEDEWNILTVKNTTFQSNKAGSNGGALYTLAGVGVYIENAEFIQNTATADDDSTGGAFTVYGSKVEINGATFTSNAANSFGGALMLDASATVTLNRVTATGNSSLAHGGFAYILESTLSIYNSTLSQNDAAKNGGAIYAFTNACLNAYNTAFNENSCADNGGAVMIYNGGTKAVLHSCSFNENTAGGTGGAIYVSNKSQVDMYQLVANDNSAEKGGFLYETTSGTVINLVGLTVSGNTASAGGAIIWGNTKNAKLYIDKSQYTDLDHSGSMDSDYWSGAIYNLLTVEEISATVPTYKDYSHTEPKPQTPPKKTPVPVTDVFDIAQNSSDGYINSLFESLPVLDKSSNFMSDSVTSFENINGETVTVDSFVYAAYAKDGIASVGEGILIYQAMLYKQAHPDEDVSISISSYRFSVEAAVNINRNSRYFGYMRNLVGREYDEFGFVRISYLLVSAAKMGINVTVIGQLDAYPISASNPNFYDYFTGHLDTPCDSNYTTGVVGDYLNFSFCFWTLTEKGGTDMMHTKLCAVSHYIDMNGVEHKNAVWTSSSNLDGISSKGYNGNWKLQTATIISNHEYIYRVSSNYLRLISENCGQEQIYEFQDFMSREGARQIDLILAGRADEIPADEQIVYLGTENDNVFELYFTPFAGDTTVWDETYNPYCKYLREMYNSEDSIIFIWNAAEYNSQFALGQEMESIIVGSFFKNKNVENIFYGMMENFDINKLNGLTVGKDIGMISLNQFHHNSVHNKDILLSYVKDGQRHYVSLLNSCNMHGGSMSYQSNFMLVIKETDCEEDSVFFNMTDLTTKGIVEHTYGEEQRFVPDTNEHGYYYTPCIYCDEQIITGIIHRPGNWITDKEATVGSNGIQHKDCTVCGSMVEMKEVYVGENEEENTNVANEGMTFLQNFMIGSGISETPMTFEALIKLSEQHPNRGGVIVGNYDAIGANQISLEIYTYGQVRLYTKTNGIKSECFFNVDIRSDVPVHIAVTVEGTVAKLYVNGALADTQTLSGGMPQISDEMMIGGDKRPYNDQYFKGEIYSLALFKDVRTATEIAKDMLLVASDTDGLLYSRSFATLPNANTVQNMGVEFHEGTTIALQPLSKTPMTLEAILSLPVDYTGRAGVVFGNYDGSNNNQLNLEIYQNGAPRLYINRAGIAETILFNADIRTGQPIHLAVVINEKTATLYINGSIVDTKDLSAAVPVITTGFKVGGDHREDNSQYFKGKIYAVGLYSKAKDAAEIKRDSILMNDKDASLLYLNYYTRNKNTESMEEGKIFTADSAVSVGTLASTPYTIETTIRLLPTVWDRAGVIVGNYDNGTGPQINLEIYYNGTVRLFYFDGNTVKNSCLFEKTDVRSYAQTHLAVTIEGQNANLYVNGKLKETQPLTSELPQAVENFKIGGDNRTDNAQYFKGEIYSVYLFGDARTAEEISSDAVSVASDTDALLYSKNFTKVIESDILPEYRPAGHTFNGIFIDRINEVKKTPYSMEAVISVPKSIDDRAGVIIGNYIGNSTDQISLEIYTMGRVRLFFITNGIRVDTIFNTDIRSDSPIHLAVTVNGLLATLYINGEAVETAELSLPMPANTSKYVIGGDHRLNNAQYFKGVIYSVALFEDVRTAEEIKDDSVFVPENAENLLYTVTYGKSLCSPYTSGNVHMESEWIIDREATAALNGLKHKECLVCGATIVVKEISNTFRDTIDIDLSENAGLLLNSEGDALNIGSLDKAPLTFEALIQLSKDVTGRGGVILGSYDGGNGNAINIEIYNNGAPRLYYKTGGIGYSLVFKTDIRSERLVHIAITIDGSTAKLYVDGIFVESMELTTALPEVLGDFNVGNDKRAEGGQYFKGIIYGVSIFSDVRTATEIEKDAILITDNADNLLYSKYYEFE